MKVSATHGIIEIPLVLWEVPRVIGILRLDGRVGQVGIVAEA